MIIGDSDGDVIMSGDVGVADNKQLKFGSSDLLIYHDTNNSYIKDESVKHYI